MMDCGSLDFHGMYAYPSVGSKINIYGVHESGEAFPVNNCCGAEHPFDSRHVRKLWQPEHIRCLIIGENPGGLGQPYFYDPIPPDGYDPVKIRGLLLPALLDTGLIKNCSREGFREAGFLFDHAIRCPFPQKFVKSEARLAKENKSSLALDAQHLKPLIDDAPKVWVMGYLARAAVAHLCLEFVGTVDGDIPAQGEAVSNKFFISPYLTYLKRKKGAEAIAEVMNRFKQFLENQLPIAI